MNKLQWHFNHNTQISIPKNASANIVCEMAAMLSGGHELMDKRQEKNHQLRCQYNLISKIRRLGLQKNLKIQA